MNKILKLFDEKFVRELFVKEVLPLYPDFTGIKKIKIHPHKELIWETTYHVVLEFRTVFFTKEGKTKTLPIFCSAHSDEPRKNVYDSLQFLWRHNFSKGYLTIPHPLFYADYFQGTFYRGVEGRNLYYYIRQKNLAVVEEMAVKAAHWFAKLHKTPIAAARNFNKENSRIATAFPGAEHTLIRIKHDYPQYRGIYGHVYKILINEEEKFFASTGERWLVHGDAHPENIIKMGQRKIAVIDFTDLCLSDFARDIGAFLQQLEFMTTRKIGDRAFTDKIKTLFLENYLRHAKITMDENLRKRINNYYNWTAIRTATYFLIKSGAEPERSKPIIEDLSRKYNYPIK